MKKSILFIFLLGSAITIVAQDQVMDLDKFTKVDAATSVNIELIKSNEHKAEIWIEEGSPDELKVEVFGNKLKIKWEDRAKLWRNDNWKRKATLKVYYKSIDELSVSAGARVESDDKFKVDDFEVDASSGGRVSIEVNADVIDADVSSGGVVDIEGSTSKLMISASSGGSFQGKELESKEVRARASSGGTAKVWATERIDASASSGGNVRYKGNPSHKDISSSKWSGGNVRNI